MVICTQKCTNQKWQTVLKTKSWQQKLWIRRASLNMKSKICKYSWFIFSFQSFKTVSSLFFKWFLSNITFDSNLSKFLWPLDCFWQFHYNILLIFYLISFASSSSILFMSIIFKSPCLECFIYLCVWQYCNGLL